MPMDRILVFNMISALLLVFGAAGFILVSRHERLQHARTADLEQARREALANHTSRAPKQKAADLSAARC